MSNGNGHLTAISSISPSNYDHLEKKIIGIEGELKLKAPSTDLEKAIGNMKEGIAYAIGDIKTTIAKEVGDMKTTIAKEVATARNWALVTLLGLIVAVAVVIVSMIIEAS